jgi:hypothetical protein
VGIVLVGRAGDRDDGCAGREQGVEQWVVDGLFLKVEDDQLGRLRVG